VPRFIAVPLVLIAAVAAFAVTAVMRSGSDASHAPSPVAAPHAADGSTLHAGDRIPVPRQAVAVSVRGGSVASVVRLDVATINRMPTVTVRLREPFLKRDVTFTGVRMQDFMAITGVSAAAQLSMRALDDYHVTLPTRAMLADGAILATSAGGKAIPVAKGGPVRLILTGKGDLAANTDNWIWSVNDIKAAR
jgi:hypothetical protein